MAVTSISNETPARLTLVNATGDQIVLAPLQRVEVAEDSGFYFDAIERAGLLTQHREAPSMLGDKISTAVLGGGFWLVIISSVLANMEPRFGLTVQIWPYAIWGTALFILLTTVVVLIIRGTNSLALVLRWTMQSLALAVILAIGLGLPAATIYTFGGGSELLAALASPGEAGTPGAASLALFGRLVQLALISTASLLPVLLFFLFDRYQLGTLRKRVYASLFRLDRSLMTTGEIDAKYGDQIREAYGADEQGRGRFGPGTRWPVLVCAFVITIGWIVALAPVGRDFAPGTVAEVMAALAPQQTATVFGFLGVYFFSLRAIALRYARGDLKPKAYTHIMVRIFVVTVLSWVLAAIFDGDSTTVLVLAFLFGITPDEFFTWIKQFTRGRVPSQIVPQAKLPLNELEGIDIYDLGRLESEGIVNIEGLAHHELIDLIIETRVPVPRLVDWMDQAILYLHLIGGSHDTARQELRDYGIRTATDLLRAWDKAAERGDDALTAFRKLLGGSDPLYRLEVIRDALLDDEWMRTIMSWRDETPYEPLVREAIAPPKPASAPVRASAASEAGAPSPAGKPPAAPGPVPQTP